MVKQNKVLLLLNFWKPVIWLFLVFYSLFTPASNAPSKFIRYMPIQVINLIRDYPNIIDKMVHFTLFFVLCVLLFRPFKLINRKYILLAPLLSSFLAITTEKIQHKIAPSRSYDLMDLYANLLGVLVATIFYFLFVNRKKWEKLF